VRCGCGQPGLLGKQYGNGRALSRDAQASRDLAVAGPADAGRPAGTRQDTGPEVTQAAKEGDPAELEITG